MQKILIAYYSRTGNTRKVAEAIKEQLACDIEEIISIKDRLGAMGLIISGKEATFKTLADIKPIEKNPANYDLVIIGTPIWAGNISSPIRGYIEKYKTGFKNISAFCTMGGDNTNLCFNEIEKICDKNLVAKLSVKAKEVNTTELARKVNSYCAEIIK